MENRDIDNGVNFIRPPTSSNGVDILTYEVLSENLKEILREMVLLIDNPGKKILKLRHPSGMGFIYINDTDGGAFNIEDYDYTKIKELTGGELQIK